MALQSQIFKISGQVRTFLSTKPIFQKQNMAVFVHVTASVPDEWVQLNTFDFELINNSAVLKPEFSLDGYDALELRVADTYDELLTSPDDISIIVDIAEEIRKVAAIDAEVVIVSDHMTQVKYVSDNMASVKLVADDLRQPYSNIEHAKENADKALLNAIEAEQHKDKAFEWAENPEDIPVDDIGGRDRFSAFHWAQKAEQYAKPIILIGEWTPTMGVEYPSGQFEDGYLWIITGVDETNGYTFAGGDLVGRTAFNGDWLIYDPSGWILTPTQVDVSAMYRRDGTLPMTADVQCGGFKVADMADGTSATDGTTLGQVNAKIVIGSYGSRR